MSVEPWSTSREREQVAYSHGDVILAAHVDEIVAVAVAENHVVEGPSPKDVQSAALIDFKSRRGWNRATATGDPKKCGIGRVGPTGIGFEQDFITSGGNESPATVNETGSVKPQIAVEIAD